MIFLTSKASRVLDKIFPKLPRLAKVAFIPTAADPYDKKPWVEADKSKLQDLGLQIYELDLKGKSPKDLETFLADKQIIFVAGVILFIYWSMF